eukprot:COSAG01_NODE_1810_length_9181_cov_22.033142_8_plen_97_part_00
MLRHDAPSGFHTSYRWTNSIYGYVYSTAHYLRWDWSRTLDTQPPKVRVKKRCAASRPADGSSAEAPSLARRKNDLALPRELSAYQLHNQKKQSQPE